jgi:hypothetical protein
VPSAASGYNFIQNFKEERMKGVNDTHVIKERKVFSASEFVKKYKGKMKTYQFF